MKHAPASFVETLETAAAAAQDHEKRYRAEAAREIERLERERVFAFRRIRLAKLLASAAPASASEAERIAAGRRAVAEEFGWDEASERHKAVLDRVGGLHRALLHPSGGSAQPSEALAQFESWYQGHAGQPFYQLFDQYVPEAPLVDF